MTDALNVGMIGVGNIAGKHIRALNDREDARIVAMADPSHDQLAEVQVTYPPVQNARTFSDHESMLEEVDLDAVVICSPHSVHFPQIMDCMEAGLDVLTEKPMVCTIDHAHEIMQKEEETGCTLGIAYQRHCDGPYQYIRNAIRNGDAGEVQYVTALQAQAWLKLTRGTWRQNKDLSCGGQLNDSGSHLIDIILWMTGLAVDEVAAEVDNFGTEVDINSALNMKFKNGALGTLSVIGNYPSSGMYEDITIVCEDWTFFLREGRDLMVKTGYNGEQHRISHFGYGAESTADNFIDAIRGEAEVLAPSVCGLRTIELTEAAWKAAEQGGPVQVEE